VQTPFRRNLAWSAVGHVGLLLLIGAVAAFAPVHKPVEIIQVMDLAPDLGVSPPGPVTPPDSAAPTPAPEPLPAPTPTVPPEPIPPEPIPPEPKPIPVPPAPQPPKPDAITEKLVPKPTVKKETPKPSRPKVAVNTNKVVRVVRNTTPTPARATATRPASSASSGAARYDPKAFSARILKQMEGSGIGGLVTAKGATGTGTGGAGQPNPFAWYFNRVFEEMYAAWQPPFGLDEGLRTQVLIRVEKNGIITKVSLAASSGNKSMDDSALAAANHVKKLPPLPDGLGGSFAEITVNFKVQRS
jgi:TonB family protein